MTAREATADVFLTALRALPKKDREAVLAKIADDDKLREEMFDLALIAQRRKEPARLFRKDLAEKAKFAIATSRPTRRAPDL
jgi:hypothetical protein